MSTEQKLQARSNGSCKLCAAGDEEDSGEVEFHKDCNGAILQNGDIVTLIKNP